MSGNLGSAAIPLFGCACLMVIMVLQVVSFASPHWATLEDGVDFGLWRYSKCRVLTRSSSLGCYSYVTSGDLGAWIRAVGGLECIAIIFWSFPLVIIPVYLYVSLGLYYTCVMVFMTIFNFVATICSIIGVIVFGAKLNEESEWDWEWCFVLAAIAAALGIITTIILLVACFKRPTFTMQTHLTSGFYVEPDRNRMYVIENVDEKPGPLEGGHVNPAMVD